MLCFHTRPAQRTVVRGDASAKRSLRCISSPGILGLLTVTTVTLITSQLLLFEKCSPSMLAKCDTMHMTSDT
jgi:hypothetical protein